MGRAQGKTAAHASAGLRGSAAPVPTTESDIDAVVAELATSNAIHNDAALRSRAAEAGALLAAETYASERIHNNTVRKLADCGLSIAPDVLPADLVAEATSIAAERYPTALSNEADRPGKDRLPPLADRARSVATRVAVDSMSSAIPAELARRSEEAVRAHATSKYDARTRELLAELGVTVEEAAAALSERQWTQIAQRWETRRGVHLHDSSADVFRGALNHTLRAVVRPRQPAAV